MPTLAQIQTAIDTRLANQWSILVQVQNNYFAAHGRYAQGLRTHSIIPSEGNEATADRLNARPTDQAESWNDLAAANGFSFPATNIATVQITPYVSPLGQGWQAVLTVRVGNNLYKRAGQVGPETWRAHGWRRVIPEEEGDE